MSIIVKMIINIKKLKTCTKRKCSHRRSINSSVIFKLNSRIEFLYNYKMIFYKHIVYFYFRNLNNQSLAHG